MFWRGGYLYRPLFFKNSADVAEFGIRVCLRYICRKACGFESHRPHFVIINFLYRTASSMVEHTVYIRKVIGSSPMSSTKGGRIRTFIL